MKGTFQHSSFLAGGATSAAGRLEAENGNLKVSREISTLHVQLQEKNNKKNI